MKKKNILYLLLGTASYCSSAIINNQDIAELINDSNIAGGSIAILNDTSGIIHGNLTNNGKITDSNTGIANNGVIYGDIINNNKITTNNKEFIINNGSVGSIINKYTDIPSPNNIDLGDIINNGEVNGDISNEFNIYGAIINNNNVSGSILNAGNLGMDSNDRDTPVIVNEGVVYGQVRNYGNSSPIKNNGLIKDGVVNEGNLISVINNGTIDRNGFKNTGNIHSVFNTGRIDGNISNQGNFRDIKNDGALNGSIVNSGNLRSITNPGIINGSVINDGYVYSITNSGVINGEVINNAFFANESSITNTGIINSVNTTSVIENNGSGLKSITNTGVINGDIHLGDDNNNKNARVDIFNGDNNKKPVINGDIVGGGSSVINIGTEEKTADFETRNNVIAGFINISKGSSLTLVNDSNKPAVWSTHQNDDISIRNNGTLSSSNSNQVTGNVLTTESGGVSTYNTFGYRETFTVKGDYRSDNGTVHFNFDVAGDDSAVTRLLVSGNTSGNTLVYVNNVNGKGAQTTKGIELISVEGDSGGEFSQVGRIVAGDYDYTLTRGGYTADTDTKNWYLTSQYVQPPTEPADPEAPVIDVLRPEIGSYVSNSQAANTLFDMQLHNRLGETQYTDALSGEKKVTSMWMRHIGGHNRSSLSQGQMKTQANRYVVQLGGDVAQWSSDGLDRYHAGVMAGYADQRSNTVNTLSRHHSKGKTSGFSAGVYGTWYASEQDKSGLYVDSWALYNWFDHEVTGDGQATEKYKSRGMTASLESGYTFKVGEYTSASDTINTFYLQPKAQVTWQGVKAKNHTETGGTTVTGSGDNNIRTRLGLRAYLHGHSMTDDGKGRNFEPFVEVSWLHNSKKYGVKRDERTYDVAGTRNIGEIKTGIEGQVSPNLNLWGNVAQQLGDAGYSDTSATLGVKYLF
ncbi:TPA: autotransporter outer membrane beta-barrel domain-containing protein [Vibrio vulnificus]|nr:autotransporter outer membrane beta-barrel domain-containing protein [Vibrio vulnificus]